MPKQFLTFVDDQKILLERFEWRFLRRGWRGRGRGFLLPGVAKVFEETVRDGQLIVVQVVAPGFWRNRRRINTTGLSKGSVIALDGVPVAGNRRRPAEN